MSSEENALVRETIHSSLVKSTGYKDVQPVLRDLAIISGNFKYTKREIPLVFTVYNRLLEKLATFPVSLLSFEQWEQLIEALCKDEQVDKSVYDLSEKEKDRLKEIEAREDSEADDLRKKELIRRNQLLLMELGIVDNVLRACWDQNLVEKSKQFLKDGQNLPKTDQDFINRSNTVMNIILLEWREISFKLDLIKDLIFVSLAYVKGYIRKATYTETWSNTVNIHGPLIAHHLGIREPSAEKETFAEELVKIYMSMLKEGVTEDSDRYLYIVVFFLEYLPWISESSSHLIEYEEQMWDSIEAIVSMVESELAGSVDSLENEEGKADSSDDWLENLFSTVPVDLDRKHASEVCKASRLNKLRKHMTDLLSNLTENSSKVDASKVKRVLHKLCDLSSTEFNRNDEIQTAFERAVKIGAISDQIQKDMIEECLNRGASQAELAVKNILLPAREDLRNELAEMVFRFFIERLKTKNRDGEKHSFSLSELLLCRSARIAMVAGKPSKLFNELLAFFNSLCAQKRIAVDPQIDEIMSLLHILFTGGNFLDYLKHCNTLESVGLITQLQESRYSLTPVGQMACSVKDLSNGFRHFALWSLTQPGDLCPPYVYPIFTENELNERNNFVVMSQMFRLRPYYKSATGNEHFKKLYPEKEVWQQIEAYFDINNMENLFARILVLFTEDLQKRTGKISTLECHYILSFHDCLLVVISENMHPSPPTIGLLRTTLKHLDLYELSLACARNNYRTGLDRLSALFKIYRNFMLNECMPFQRMVDDCVLGTVVDMMHHDKKKTISPAYKNTYKLSYEKLDCVLSADEPTVIEGIIECIRSELCTFFFHLLNQPSHGNAWMDEMVKFCIEVASSAQYSMNDAETANTFLTLLVQENYAPNHTFLMETMLSVATSIDPQEAFEVYPLNKLFGDVLGELFCSEIYSKKWMKDPSMVPFETYLDKCASDEPCAMNPTLAAALSNIFNNNAPHSPIKELLEATIANKIHLLPKWINNSLYPAITLAEFAGVLDCLGAEVATKIAEGMTDCVEKVIRESVIEELSEFIPIEVQSTDRFAQSWLCSRKKKEPRVYSHYKLVKGKTEMRKFFEEVVALLCQYGNKETHLKISAASSSVLGNWCGLTGTEEKVVRGETVLKENYLLFRLNVANTLLQYTTELFAALGDEKNDGYFSDNNAIKELVSRRGISSISSGRIGEGKAKSSNQLCSYTQTESKYIQQHWYNCYTCSFTSQTGCCSICVVNCHRGHDVVYSKLGSFFCDCGAKKCQSMKATSFVPSANNAARGRKLNFSNAGKCDELEEDLLFSFPDNINEIKDQLLPYLTELRTRLSTNFEGIENAVRASVDAHINTYDIESKRNHVLESLRNIDQIKMVTDQPVMDIMERETKLLTNISTPRRAPDQQNLDGLRPKDMCGRIQLENGRQLWLMLDGAQITIHHIAQGDNIIDELNTTRQEVEQLSFAARRMSCTEDKAVILGRSEVLLLRFNTDGDIKDKTPLNISEISTHTNPFIKAVWAPKRAGIIGLATTQYVRIYDISMDTNNHLEELVLPVGNIQDIMLIEDQGFLILLVFSTAGHLYRHVVTAIIPQNNSIFLTNTLNVPTTQTGNPVSFHYSPSSRIFFISYENTSYFGVVPLLGFRVEGPLIEWRKIPSEHAFTCWQESSGIIAAMNHQGGYCVTYFYPTNKQLLMQKIDSNKRVPYAHLLYTSPSNTTVNGLLFYYDVPYVVPLSSNWLNLPDLWIDGLPLEFTTTMEIVKEDIHEDLPLEDLMPMMENCEVIERVDVQSSDLLRTYDPQDLSHRLSQVGAYPVTWMNTNPININFKVMDSNYIARLIRIEVPGENKGPTKVTIGREGLRSVVLNTPVARFFDIPLTRSETLAMEKGNLQLKIISLNTQSTINSIRLYGIRRRDFGFPTPQLSSKAPLSLPEEHLKHILRLLYILTQNEEIVYSWKWLVKITEQLVSIRSTNKEVCQAGNNLLRVLFEKKKRIEYYDLKDRILYEDLVLLAGSTRPLPGIIVDRLVYQIKMILTTRCWRFLERIKKEPNGAINLLTQIRNQLRLQSLDDCIPLVEVFSILSFIFMGSLDPSQSGQVYETFLGVFLDDKAYQHATVTRFVSLNLIGSFVTSIHTDRQRIKARPGSRLLKDGGLLPYYGKTRIMAADEIPKMEEMMGTILAAERLKGTNMYDMEASFLVELLRKVLYKIREDGVIITQMNLPCEPPPTLHLVMFAYMLLHHLCPEKILPTIVELINMVDWENPLLQRDDNICRQFLLFRLVVFFLTRCTEYTDDKRKKKQKSRENSEEASTSEQKAPTEAPNLEEIGKKESYERLLQGITKKLIEVDCLNYCLKMLQQTLLVWRGPLSEQSKNGNRAWGRFNENLINESVRSDDDHKDHFYGTIMQLGVRLPLQMKKIEPNLQFPLEWNDVLCEIMLLPYSSTIRHYARKLMILFYNNDRPQYKAYKDMYLMRSFMRALRDKFKDNMNHKELTDIVDIISSLTATATERPTMWRTICEEHLPWLLDMVTRVADAVTTNVLELLVAAIRVETSTEESQHLANQLVSLDENKDSLKRLLRRFLVGRDEPRRWLAHGLVRSTIQLASRQNQMTLVRIMWYELWPEARESGANGAQLADLLATYLPRVFNTNELLSVCEMEMKAIRQISDRIVSEGHDRTYEMMMSLGLGFNFMLMVSNPCLNCFSKKRACETMKLSSIKQDLRYSSNAHMIKLIGYYELSRVIVKLSDVKKAKTVKKVSVFYCPKVVDSPVELKTKSELWQLAGSTTVTSSEGEMLVSLSVPVVTSTLIIQFTEVTEAKQSSELQCPRCSSAVQPNPGVCENCGENAYQCFKCRSINYDDKDPFLCQHCGFCKYARIDISVVCRPLPRVQPIITDVDRNAAVEHMSQLLVDVEQSRSQMLIGRAMCEALWMKTRPLPCHGVRAEGTHIAEMAVAGMPIIPINEHGVYCIKEIINYCTLAHDELCSQTQQLLAYRDELLQYDGSSKIVNSLGNGFYNTSSSCFGCLCTGIRHSIAILQGACDDSYCTEKILSSTSSYLEIVKLGKAYSPIMPDVESFMCRLAFENEGGSSIVCDLVEKDLLPGSVLCKCLTLYTDSFWEIKLRSLLKTAVEKSDEDTVISTLQVIERILHESAGVRKRAYRKMQYKENDPSEDIPQRRVKITNRHVDNRANLTRWMNRRGSWEECEKSTETITIEEEKTLQGIDQWLWQCLFSQWTLVRSTSAKVLHSLSKHPGYLGSCIRIVIRGMTLARDKPPQITEQFFNAVHSILNRRKHLKMRLYLHGLHVHLLTIIHEECRSLYLAEHNGTTIDHGNGILLRNYIEALIILFCGDASEGFLLKAAVPHIMKSLFQANIYLKRLLLHRTRSIDICRNALELLLRKVSSKEPLLLMHTAVKNLEDDVDQFTQAQIFTVFMEVLAPERHKDDGFLIQIEKDPAQEDFLQGRMTGNPYRSNDAGMGPLMRDIKNKICRDTEMITLLEDDNGMELLVNNQIISLSLPVARVYEKLWHRDHPGQPLTIVYRMRGLMGDAVEQFIETLGTAEENSAEDTALSALVEQFDNCGGISKTLTIVEKCDITTGGRLLLGSVLNLLDRISKAEKGRVALVKAGGIRVFTKVLRRCVESQDDSMLAIGKDFLRLLNGLVKDTNTHEYLHGLTAQDAQWLVSLALKKIDKEKDLSEEVVRILGNLILGNDEAEQVLVKCCQDTLRWCVIDTTTDVAKRKEIVEDAEILCDILLGILPSTSGNRFKNKIISAEILAEACGYLTNSHPPLYSATESQEWKTFLMRPSLRLMLTFMNSMVKKHLESQNALSETSLPLLHRLEQVASDNSIGTLAENVMESLKENEAVSKKIEAVRLETKQKKRQMAMAMRNKQLSKMGMQIGKQGEVKISNRKIANEPHLEEVVDPLTACCICREPVLSGEKASGVYAFATVSNVIEHVNVLNTVSQMVLVHIDCHMAAVRRSGGGRNSDEWSKAMLHNAGAKCNVLTPLAINESPFQQALARYQTDLDVLTSTPAVTRGIVFLDLCLLIDRFINFTSFSDKSQGGGRESNAQYLGVLHLLACSLPASDELRTLLPQWCIYSFLLTEETLEQWKSQRTDVLDVALKNNPADRIGWAGVRSTCLAWGFVDLYFKEVIPISGERLPWLREHFLETMKRSSNFIQNFDTNVAACADFREFADVFELNVDDFTEALQQHQVLT